MPSEALSDPLLLSRIQFALTIAFHILFPTLTIGLSAYLVVMEALYLRTRKETYLHQYQFWVKVFALAFGLGVVSGIVLAYQFGTNWSRFIQITGNVISPLMAFEVLTAFFLEAGFLGIMLFGWGRVSARVHFLATCLVSLGTMISAFWILAANSWMHTPAGFTVDGNGTYLPADWVSVVFNPSFPYRFSHMLTASLLTATFVVAGISAWYLLKGQSTDFARKALSMTLWGALIFAPLQLVLGDLHGLNTRAYQPAKIAAMEGLWETTRGAPLLLFGLPDAASERNAYALEVPGLASLILTHDWQGEVRGLRDFPVAERPPVGIVFWAFRIMVGIGLALIGTALWGLWLRRQGRFWQNRTFLRLLVLLSPAGFLATLAGWIVTEVGRQPYIVYGHLRTSDALSPVTGGQVAGSLLAFIIIYSALMVAFLYYTLKHIRKGPPAVEAAEPPTAFGQQGRTLLEDRTTPQG